MIGEPSRRRFLQTLSAGGALIASPLLRVCVWYPEKFLHAGLTLIMSA